MKDSIRQRLNEEMTKSEVKAEVNKYMDSSEFRTKVEKIVKDRIKNEKGLEDKVVEISKNVLSQLFKQLWIKRSAYINGLTNKAN